MEPVPAPPDEPSTGETPPAPGPVMDVTPPPSAESKSKVAVKPTKPPAPAPPKSPRDSVTTAIVATVIIILGLALLTVFAYLKTQK